MVKPLLKGTWLLIDAAGPESIIGLVRDGKWLAWEHHEGDFLEWHQPSIGRVLEKAGLSLPELEGALYASGPGSTLGLRLAAMLIRSLMETPALAHWQCYQYQNLEVSLVAGAGSGWEEGVAPWRRDYLHHCRLKAREPLVFQNDGLSAADLNNASTLGILLGRRPANIPALIQWQPYPFENIPAVLQDYPELLVATLAPHPYSAEAPQFAKWSSKRHSRK